MRAVSAKEATTSFPEREPEGRVVAQGPPARSKPSPGRAFVTGGLSGALELLVMYPTEYVKTQLQLQSSSAAPVAKLNGLPYAAAAAATATPTPMPTGASSYGVRPYSGMWDCGRQTVAREGWAGLYRGMSPLMAFAVPKIAVRFAAFEELQGLVLQHGGGAVEGRTRLTRGETFVTGLGAGVVEALAVVTPQETLKTRFIDATGGVRRGLLGGVRDIVASEGVSGLYRGVWPTVARQASNQAVRFSVYGMLTQWMRERRGAEEGDPLRPSETMAAGALAGTASVVANNPVDVVKTQMQKRGSAEGVLQCVRRIHAHHGYLGFYKGAVPRIVRVSGDAALIFTLYDLINQALDALDYR